jgi:hypothetical protein
MRRGHVSHADPQLLSGFRLDARRKREKEQPGYACSSLAAAAPVRPMRASFRSERLRSRCGVDGLIS